MNRPSVCCMNCFTGPASALVTESRIIRQLVSAIYAKYHRPPPFHSISYRNAIFLVKIIANVTIVPYQYQPLQVRQDATGMRQGCDRGRFCVLAPAHNKTGDGSVSYSSHDVTRDGSMCWRSLPDCYYQFTYIIIYHLYFLDLYVFSIPYNVFYALYISQYCSGPKAI